MTLCFGGAAPTGRYVKETGSSSTQGTETERPEIVEQLKGAFDRWNSEMIDPLWPPIGVKASPAYSVDGIAIDWPV
jgi:hypothetical protein